MPAPFISTYSNIFTKQSWSSIMSKKELLAEYNTLRNEIINRIQNQHDIFKYTFVAILSLLSINYLSKNEYIFIFIFVILIISKISYQYNKIQSIKISTYIKFFINIKI